MKHLAQPLGTALLEGGVDPLGSGRALAQRLFYAPLVEALYGGACCLGIAAQRAGDPVGVLSSGAGKQDLAPTEDEGFRRAQALLQCLALGVRERTHEDRSFHSDQRSTLRTTCSEDALGFSYLLPASPEDLKVTIQGFLVDAEAPCDVFLRNLFFAQAHICQC